MKRYFFLFLTLLACESLPARAQVVPSAVARQFSVNVGGIGTAFQPDYGPNKLIGIGAFVDVKFSRWVQVEGEGRWLRWNQYQNVYQDNYLIGPRVPLHKFWKATPYAKVLIGVGKMNFNFNYATGRFTDIAYGGGVDIAVSKRLSVRAVDFEYQQWPAWLSSSLYPYGVSAGVSYRILGGR
jgi:hypothetical protein